jgi:hypothetical protein
VALAEVAEVIELDNVMRLRRLGHPEETHVLFPVADAVCRLKPWTNRLGQ